MRIKSLFTLFVLAVLLATLVLGLAGCGGESSPESSAQGPVAATQSQTSSDTSENAEPPVVEDLPSPVSEPQTEETAVPAIEPEIEAPADQPILTWARDAGGLSHCDRMSVYSDGRIEAVVCRARTSEPMAYGALDEGQLAQVLGWAAEYASFSRREMSISSAVSTTQLFGTGSDVPALEVKVEIAAFASRLFFSLTGTQ
ncbi:hypothetical protein KKG90_00805 [Candidatus Bipolaricaulota bacterium]|nr:hypothetical protein [Candidatus Bipolaricaulota bacterium]